MADGGPLLLTGGAYTAKSVNSQAQSCENLYMEGVPQDTSPPTPTTHYPRPGKTIVGSPSMSGAGGPGAGRGLFTASSGQLFAVINDTLYFVDPTWKFFVLGNIFAGSN